MPSLRVEHETLPGGELALVRLVGRLPGPAGTATVEMGNGFMLVVDAAEPDQVVEILLRAPVDAATSELLSRLAGEAVSTEILHDGASVEMVPSDHLVTAGRLALLYLVRDAMPVPTSRGIWAIEAAALAASIPARVCAEHALGELIGAHPHLEALVRRFPDAPGLARLVADLGQDALEVGRVLESLERLLGWFAQPGCIPPDDPLPERGAVAGVASVSWDRVRPGVVDPREGAVEYAIAGRQRRHVSVRVLAQQGRPARHERTALLARVFDATGRRELQSVPLTLDAGACAYRGSAILPAEAGEGPFVIDVTDDPDQPAPSEELLARNHARREAFRALFLERRAARDATLAEWAAARWQEAATEYERLGAVELAALARQRADTPATGAEPFAAELGVPVDLLGGPGPDPSEQHESQPRRNAG